MQILPIPYLTARQDVFIELYDSPVHDPYRIVGRVVLQDGKSENQVAALITEIRGPDVPPGIYRIRAIPPPVEQGPITIQGVQIVNLYEERDNPYQHWPFVLFMRGIEREERG